MHTAEQRIQRVKSLVGLVTVLLLWITVSGSSFADLTIVSNDEEGRSELWLKDNRVAQAFPGDDGGVVLFCNTQELLYIGPPSRRQYWRGTVTVFFDGIDEVMDGLMTPLESAGFLGGLLSGLLGSESAKDIDVRVRRVGEETINGYVATHYRVETNEGKGWRLYEDVWMSRQLMHEVRAEVGDCVTHLTEVIESVFALVPFGMEEFRAVHQDADYKALFEQAIPVRTKTVLRVFGMEEEVSDEVVDVHSRAIDESVFQAPPDYTRVNNLVSLLEVE